MQNLPKLSHLQAILHSLDKDSDLYESQAEVCALVAQLESNSYTVYSRDFGNMSWKDECNALGVPHEAMEVKLALFVKEVKIDTSDMAKRFCLDNNLIGNYGGERYYYDHPDNDINDMQIAHIEGDKIVYDIEVDEMFTLHAESVSLSEYKDGDVVRTNDDRAMKVLAVHSDHMLLLDENEITHCYTLDGKAMSVSGETGKHSENLDLKKAKFKIGDTFNTQFDYYEEGEIVTHTIASIDFSKEEADEVVYWDNNFVYCTESELMKQKYGIFTDDNKILYTPDNWEAEEHDGKEGVTGKYILDVCDCETKCTLLL